MPVTVLTTFPNSFISGDALRVKIADSRYPSSLWTLKVWFQSPTATQDFTAPAGAGGAYDLFITPAQSAALAAGKYLVGLVYTEIASPNDRRTSDCEFPITVLANPAVARAKTNTRLILEAMEAAMLKLAAGSNATVNFNGQSFTKRNLAELQNAIDRQRAIVAGEDSAATGKGSLARIVHPL